MEAYDPDESPSPAEWLALSELERIDIVEDFHAGHGHFGENLRLHATMHAIVENQLALVEPSEARDALFRLTAAGHSRHDAIHAIGAVIAEFLFPLLKASDDTHPFDASQYKRALRDLRL